MKRRKIHIDEDLEKKVEALAKEVGTSFASIVRQSLEFYLLALEEGGIKPKIRDGRVERSKLFSPQRRLRHPGRSAKLKRFLEAVTEEPPEPTK